MFPKKKYMNKCNIVSQILFFLGDIVTIINYRARNAHTTYILIYDRYTHTLNTARTFVLLSEQKNKNKKNNKLL